MHDYNLFAQIKKLLSEDHTKEEIKALSTSELKKLHGEYLEKGTEEDKAEAAEIKKEIDSRGEEGEEKLEEATRGGWGMNRAHTILRDNQRATDAVKKSAAAAAAAKAKKEAEGKKKSEVQQQNEELLAILDVLCEMAGLDVEALVEETRKEMENLGRAYSWDKPAPANKPHGSVAANARDVIVRANMARLGSKRSREGIKTGEQTAHEIERSGDDGVHEPTAAQRAKGAPSVVKDLGKFDKVQDSIEGIADKFTMDRVKKTQKGSRTPFSPETQAHLENLRRLAKPKRKKK